MYANENIACIRLRIHEKVKTPMPKPKSVVEIQPVPLPEPIIPAVEPKPTASLKVPPKEVKVLETNEKEMLRQSFVQKTSAIEYVQDIGGDVLDEIRDLESLDEEWIEKLHTLESEPTCRKYPTNLPTMF
jgi:hypothetical protein